VNGSLTTSTENKANIVSESGPKDLRVEIIIVSRVMLNDSKRLKLAVT